MNTPIVALMCSMPSCQSNLCSILYRFDVDNHVLHIQTFNLSYCKCEWRVLLSVSLGKKRKILCKIIQENHMSSYSNCCILSFIIFFYLYFNVVFCDYGILSNNCDFLSCAVVSKVQMMVICVTTKVNKQK